MGDSGSPAGVCRGRDVAALGRQRPVFRMTGEGRTIGARRRRSLVSARGRQVRRQSRECRAVSSHFTTVMLLSLSITTARERKVYIDPRLEVAGPDLFRRYTHLEQRIKKKHAGVGSRAS